MVDQVEIILLWSISSYTGWGLSGLNLALAWASDQNFQAVCAYPISLNQIQVDNLRYRTLQPFLENSTKFVQDLEGYADCVIAANAPILVALGNGMLTTKVAKEVTLQGSPNIGMVFLEEPLGLDAIERAKRFPLLIAGSPWNERILRAYGLDNVRTVIQGVDTTYFHPAPKLNLMPDRFLIFSGGKLELRKAQDIVLAAFKIFVQRHQDAMLVTAWHSPWSQFAIGLDRSGLVAPVIFDKSGRVDVAAWFAANGIMPEAFLDLGPVPNPLMPQVLREMDVAVFPNRCEGGTNLVAMECMACGVPVILARNTGQEHLIEPGNCYVLEEQREVDGLWAGVGDVLAWRESSVEEVVACLEDAYVNRSEAQWRGARAAKMFDRLTWAAYAHKIKELVLDTV